MGRTLHRALQQNLDGQPLKQECESAVRFSPRDRHLEYSVRLTFDARNPRSQVRQELAVPADWLVPQIPETGQRLSPAD